MLIPSQQAPILMNRLNRPSIYGQSTGEVIQSMAVIHIHRELELPNCQHIQCPEIKCKNNRSKQ